MIVKLNCSDIVIRSSRLMILRNASDSSSSIKGNIGGITDVGSAEKSPSMSVVMTVQNEPIANTDEQNNFGIK